jgi:hypothetical protein
MLFDPISERFSVRPLKHEATYISRMDLTSSIDALFLGSAVLTVSGGLAKGLELSAETTDFWTALMVSKNVLRSSSTVTFSLRWSKVGLGGGVRVTFCEARE